MREPTERNFGVADGLVLVAATAAGLASTRMWAPYPPTRMLFDELFTPRRGWSVAHAAGVLAVVSLYFVPFLAAWTSACLLLRLRGPRGSRRRLVRQPGAMACLVATVAVVLVAVAELVSWTMASHNDTLHMQREVGAVMNTSRQAGIAVFWCWVTMVLFGHWRPEASWLDRSGCSCGAAWMVTAIIFECFQLTLGRY